MLKTKLCIALLGLAAFASATTSNYSGGMNVGRMWSDNGGLYVGFTSRPADCGGDLYGIHAFIPNTRANYKDVLAMLITAKTTDMPVDIWYDTQSSQYSCSTWSTLLPINAVGFH